MKEVVVTGLGAVTPLGTGVEKSWSGLLQSLSAVDRIQSFDCSSCPVKIAGEVRDFVPEDFIPKKDQKKTSRFTHFALASAKEAIESSGLNFEKDEALRRSTNVIIGVGIGDLQYIQSAAYQVIKEKKPPSPFFIPSVIANAVAGNISIRWKLMGSNFSTVSACASGAHAIGEAGLQIQQGLCDVAIAGGAESVFCELAVFGFHSIRALSTRNDEPKRASRPWDRGRDGFILSEGAGVLVLEEKQRALKRGATILAELVGYGSSSDAYHIAIPEPKGKGICLAMEKSLESAKIAKNKIDYINAHSTSTLAGDAVESKSIQSVFGEHSQKLLVSSNKSMIGHTLGAAGAIESVFSILSLRDQVAPATINLEEQDPECSLDFVPNEAREKKMQFVMNNSFGFGGTNVCLIFKKVNK